MSSLYRSTSLPLVYEPTIIRTGTTTPYILNKSKGISTQERDFKIEEFEKYKENAEQINQGRNSFTADEITTEDPSGELINFFYFIGRLNPPHSGHLKALETLVRMANDKDSIPLILLGSGPGGLRTMDNPITFELKAQFIDRLLQEKMPGSKYKIEKMTNPSKNIADYIKEGLELKGDSIIPIIKITHIAGGKDEDTTKLVFALKSAEKTAKGLVPDADIITNVEPIEAETIDNGSAMSATKVRKDAYKSILDNGKGFEEWEKKYGIFYGANAKQIYDEILFPIQSLSDEEILNYINNGILPKSVGQKRKRGGTKRKKLKRSKIKQATQKRKKRANHRKY